MNIEPDLLEQTLRERGARYVVGTQGQPVAVLLSIDEYEHHLDLLDDEADSQDKELAARLAQATTWSHDHERQDFREYLNERQAPGASIQS
jgi:PHD/YefM family antitoxin component YafN of YafNO toxin-antitoxin module